MKNKWQNVASILIIFIFILKQFYLALLIPPFEAPDEPAHVAYIMFLYEKKGIPSKKEPFLPQNLEVSFEKIRKDIKNLKENKIKRELFNVNNKKLTKISISPASHPPLYYLLLLPIYNFTIKISSYKAFLSLRLFSILLGVLTLIFVYKISTFFFRDSFLRLCILFSLSMQPMFSFMNAVVNNDNLLTFLFTLTLFLLLKKGKNNNKIKTNLFLGIVIALSILTKPSAIALFPLLIFAKKIWSFTFPTVVFLLWYGYKIAQEGINYLWFAVENPFLKVTNPLLYPLKFILSKQFVGIFMSFWGFFGWLNVPMPKIVYLVYLFMIIIALIGLLKRKWKLNNRYKIILTLALSLTLFIFSFDLQKFTLSSVFVIHGRYFIPILSIFFILLFKGLDIYKIKKALFIVYCFIFLLLQIVAIFTISKYYYGVILPDILPYEIYF